MQVQQITRLMAVLLCSLLIVGGAHAQAEMADQEVSAQLRQLVHPSVSNDKAKGDLDRNVAAFYSTREFRPAWNNAATVAAFGAALQTLQNDGLNPDDYGAGTLADTYRHLYGADLYRHVASVKPDNANNVAQQRARFDLATTRAYLMVLKHLNRGKVDPQTVDTDSSIESKPFDLDIGAVSQAVDTQTFDTVFDLARPSYPIYKRLRAGLARYRDIEHNGGWPTLPSRDEALRPGERSPDVLILRQRLAATGAPVGDAADPQAYDETLVAAVRSFQRNQYLMDDGVVGKNTRAALNVSVKDRIDQIRVNLERARWLLHGLPESYVLVDIAGFQLTYYQPDGSIWRSKVVVGKPYRKTPSLRSQITYLTFNPTWTIPPTVLQKDILPKVRQDPGYLRSKRIHVLNMQGEEIDPASVDWQHPSGIMLRQEPGPNNALGRVIVRFPNEYMVYLHDTPAQSLFSREQRAFSSGCIRVDNVREFVRLLLNNSKQWSDSDIDRTIAEGETQNVTLNTPVPVIVHYWTVNVAENGELTFKPDIYHRDDVLEHALDRAVTL
ncbi:L,D-transpeptidase family protein [Phytohalomonas tamaricis]|uniref:L,D-transpeptidase family protein n=1 Tax=Phytohalomonas tamaricis TaxID=2081032 RepID=UPI00131A0480|nr:L,D-transpeptidase family protein [Phytohalomonas tamaricis]